VCHVTTIFTAATYNVLAQSFAHADRYPGSPPEALDPTRRLDLLLDRIGRLDADLLCLQELERETYGALWHRLEATHDGAYAGRANRPDGVAVFAKRYHFGYLRHDVLHLEANRDRSPNLALIGHLNLDGRPLHVVCAHLASEPRSTPQAEHAGYHQMLELLDHRDRVAPDDTWIFAGDFNAGSDSFVLKAALDRGLDDSCRGRRPWDTAFINGRPRELDYLLFSKGRLDAHPRFALKPSGEFPSLIEPSDHIPLRVDLTPLPATSPQGSEDADRVSR
jgi:endonuclease/exonuclease/phosphatase family metal-dependent hydrolase